MDFDNYADNYNELLKRSTSGIVSDASSIANYKAETLRQVLERDPQTILDYGCGIGNNLSALREKFQAAKVFGFDISERSLEVAAMASPGCSFIRQDELSSHQGQFDVVFVSCVLHHIREEARMEFARTAFDLTKPGGSIVVIEHNIYNPLTRIAVCLCPYDRDAVLIRASKVRELLSKSGFTKASSKYILFAPPSWGETKRIEKLIKHLPLGGQHITSARKPCH